MIEFVAGLLGNSWNQCYPMVSNRVLPADFNIHFPSQQIIKFVAQFGLRIILPNWQHTIRKSND